MYLNIVEPKVIVSFMAVLLELEMTLGTEITITHPS